MKMNFILHAMVGEKHFKANWVSSACFGEKLVATSRRGAQNRWRGALGVFAQCYSERARRTRSALHTGFLARRIQSKA